MLANELLGVDEHDRILMAPKLLAKADAISSNASDKEMFRVRAVSSQIGWLETSMTDTAAGAVSNVELLLSSRASESSVAVDNQLKIFESWERGLLSTWETPDRAHLRPGDMFVSTITEHVTVTIECRGTAQVRVEHLGSLREKPLLDEIDHPLHRFTLIDRVGDHPFQPCG